MLSQLRDNIDEFRRLNAQVFGISVDTHYTQQVFALEKELDFDLLSDFNREAMAAYGIEIEEFNGYRGIARRSIFVVGPDGKIVHSDISMGRGVRPDVGAALEAVRGLSAGEGNG